MGRTFGQRHGSPFRTLITGGAWEKMDAGGGINIGRGETDSPGMSEEDYRRWTKNLGRGEGRWR